MFYLFDTYTRKKRVFKPLKDKEVRIYACGPTVYSNVHIGNLSTFIFVDFLIHYLRFLGYKIKYVRNITDVGHLTSDSDTGEDKLDKASRKEGIKPLEIAQKYTKAFHENTKALNLLEPDLEPKATDYIQEQIEAVKKLLEKDYAYETDSGIYFDTSKDKEYGKLAKLKIDKKQSRCRVKQIEDKKHPEDFALWIKAVGKHKNHIQNWDSPWGRGFPGWHLECSIMSQEYLGKKFDIHCGGIDLVPVHHINEIAQSKALYENIPANFWVHKEYLQISGSKMAKSLGNFITLADLDKSGYSPEVFKLFVLSSNYRSKLQFSEKALRQAQENLQKIRNFLLTCTKSNRQKSDSKSQKRIQKFWQDFQAALNNNLNTPKSLAEIFNLIKVVEKQKYNVDCKLILEKFRTIQDIFGITLIQKAKTQKISVDIQKLLDKRLAARKQQDYKKSDQIRDELAQKNISIKDKGDGSQEVVYD